MPTYLYECKKCGRFEKMQRISDDPLEKCPECTSEVKRIIGNPGIIFKGSGFYATDSKNGSSSTPSKKTAADSKDDDSKNDSKDSDEKKAS